MQLLLTAVKITRTLPQVWVALFSNCCWGPQAQTEAGYVLCFLKASFVLERYRTAD